MAGHQILINDLRARAEKSLLHILRLILRKIKDHTSKILHEVSILHTICSMSEKKAYYI